MHILQTVIIVHLGSLFISRPPYIKDVTYCSRSEVRLIYQLNDF